MSKTKINFLLLSPLILGSAALPSLIKKAPSNTSADLFNYSSSLIKAKANYFEASVNSKGLLVYGYDDNVSISLKTPMSGVFNTDILALSEAGNINVGTYSLKFSDVKTNKSFRFVVNSYSGYSEAFIEYGGVEAGIRYAVIDWSKEEVAKGYTAGFNAQGAFNKYDGYETKMSFDPTSLNLKILGSNGVYHDLWDFSKEFNDGKRLKNDLVPFDLYNVTLTLEKVSPDTKASLLVKTFGNYDFTIDAQYSRSISASFNSKAILNEAYEVPLPKIFDPFKGEIDSSLAKITIYNEAAEVVSNNRTFTPTTLNNYYVEYSYGANTVKSYAIPVVDKATLKGNFSFEETYDLKVNNELGLHSSIYLPKAKIQSDLLTKGIEEAKVDIKKDGTLLTTIPYKDLGRSYTFDEYGTYEIIYLSNTTSLLNDKRIVDVSKSKVGYILPSLPTSLKKGDSLTISDAKAYLEGREYEAIATLYLPNGESKQKEATLSLSGRYELRYEFTRGGKVYQTSTYFELYDKRASLFNGDKCSSSFGIARANEEYSGTNITLKDSAKMVYSKVIDLSDNHFDESLPDYEKNTKLIELRANPHSSGTVDAESLYIELIDVNDPTNILTIRNKYLSYMPNFSRIRAKAPGQAYGGIFYNFDTGLMSSLENAEMHEDGGFISTFDFSLEGNDREYKDTSLQLYFDNDTGRLYAKHWQLYGTAPGYTNNRVPWLVRDFMSNDKAMSGGDNAWTGFSDGKVIMSIYATGVTSTADFLITNVDGEDFTNENLVDTEAPTISLDIANLPNGEVARAYPFPSFISEDKASKIKEQKVEVYSKNKLIQDGGTSFTPETTGTYTLVFVARDYFGNEARLSKDVEIISSSERMEISLDGSLPTTASRGEYITLPKIKATGGVGLYTTNIEVSCDNEPVEVKDNRFLIDKGYDYTIRFITTDYIGNSAKIIKKITNITTISDPQVDENALYLPPAFFEGDSYDLANFVGQAYSGKEDKIGVTPTITIQDGSGTKTLLKGERYSPKTSNTVKNATITYTFTNEGKSKEIVREIPIRKISSKTDMGFIKEYFVSNNEITALDEGMSVAASSSGLEAYFLRNLFGKEFSLNWNDKNISSYTISLRDSLNYSLALNFHFRKDGNALYCSINGNKEFRYFETGDGDAGLRYSAKDNAIKDSRGRVVYHLEEIGFIGFPSNELSLKISSEETSGSFLFLDINNQKTNIVRRDSAVPLTYTEDNLSGRFTLGTEIKIPSLVAYDTLGTIKKASATISLNGAVIKKGTPEEIGSTFKPTEVGEYKITFVYEDSSGNRGNTVFYFTIYDSVLPELVFNGAHPKTVYTGQNINLPSYEAKGRNVKVYQSVETPDSTIVSFSGNTFKAELSGIYTFNYLLIDETGNINFYSFNVLSIRRA